MALSPYELYGDFTTPRLIGRTDAERGDGIDGITLVYVSSNRNQFSVGQAVLGYRIDDITKRDEGADIIEHTLNCTGLLGGTKHVTGFPVITDNGEDWDTVEDEVLSTSKNFFRRGQFGSYTGTTVCVKAQSKPANFSQTIWRCSASFKGIITQKNYRRSVTCNGEKVSGDSITVNLENGWLQPRKGTASLPKIVVTDTYLSTSLPPTNNVPGSMAPPSAPVVRIIPFNGSGGTSHWPSGWVFTTAYRKLADATLYEVDWIYEYQLKYTP